MSVPLKGRYRRYHCEAPRLVPVGHAAPARDRLRPYRLKVSKLQRALDRITRAK